MYDKGKIITGLVIGILILSFPIWYNLGSAASKAPVPKKAEGQCILPKAEMKVSHMQVLDDWRNIVVRDGKRFMKTADGRTFNMSLQNTCMKCHDSKKEFCDKCHDYTATVPFCWECHIPPVEPKEKK